jgi:glycosyltransferase involved in cell wall biosynthesis
MKPNGHAVLPTPKPAPLFAFGVPCGDMLHSEFAFCLAAMSGMGVPEGYRLGLARGQSSIIVQARNNIIEAVQHMGADYLLFLDSDMTFPANTAQRLLAHGKPIVGCAYKRRCPPYETMGRPLKDEKVELSEGLHEMRHLPLGVMLINMSVFDSLTKPYFRIPFVEGDNNYGEDLDFCNRVREAGHRVWCDVKLSQEIGHRGMVTFSEHGIVEIRAMRAALEEEARVGA